MTITLPGEPRSTNHIWKHTCRSGYLHTYMTEQGRELKELYWWEVKRQYRGKPLTGPLRVSATFYFGTKRLQDVDNFSKIALDVGNGLLWEDDVQIEELTLRKAYDKAAPRIELSIDPL